LPDHEPTAINRTDAQIEQLGPCRLITALGSGGMGTVWRAEMLEDRAWAALGATVAVKVMVRLLPPPALAPPMPSTSKTPRTREDSRRHRSWMVTLEPALSHAKSKSTEKST